MRPETAALLAEARVLAEAATPGPWRYGGADETVEAWSVWTGPREDAGRGGDLCESVDLPRVEDAALIARSRTLIPELVTAAQAEITELTAAVAGMTWTYLPELPPWPAEPGDSLPLLVTYVDYRGKSVVGEADVNYTHDDYWGATPEQIGKWYIRTAYDVEFHYPDYKGLVAWMLMPGPAEPRP